ncbi:9052_t:CDS:2 [Diversispora eburnea]|uniref:Metalloendopeptidase n=1 Tax=Diversispora eburnea TaxID=1213867 RepID=A0A9N9A460_9GLOM|nr:9052_t:CDS:2 [Diversispora eburnea]
MTPLSNLKGCQEWEHTCLLDSELYYVRTSDGKCIYGGDINIESLIRRKRASFNANPVKKWKNGIVPYIFGASLPNELRNNVLKAMEMFKDCSITFVERTNEMDYLKIINGKGYWSSLGRIGGMQELSIAPGNSNDPVGASAHQLMHALGFWHEHTRLDRDDWITVRGFETPFFKSNFAKHQNTIDIRNRNHGLYDLKSIMHYALTDYIDLTDPTDNTIISMTPTLSAQRGMLGQNINIFLGRNNVTLSDGNKKAIRNLYFNPRGGNSSYEPSYWDGHYKKFYTNTPPFQPELSKLQLNFTAQSPGDLTFSFSGGGRDCYGSFNIDKESYYQGQYKHKLFFGTWGNDQNQNLGYFIIGWVSRAEESQSLEGIWSGYYFNNLNNSNNQMVINLTATALRPRFGDNLISGSGSDSVGEFTIEGRQTRHGLVNFIKHYSTHSWNYDGKLSGMEIWGKWYYSGIPNDGVFIIWKCCNPAVVGYAWGTNCDRLIRVPTGITCDSDKVPISPMFGFDGNSPENYSWKWSESCGGADGCDCCNDFNRGGKYEWANWCEPRWIPEGNHK